MTFEEGRSPPGNRPNPLPIRRGSDRRSAERGESDVKQSRANLDAAHASAKKAADAVQQAQAALNGADGALANAQANAAKWRAAYDLAKTEEAMAVNLQKVGIGAISLLKVDEAKQKAREQEAALQ